ncbi:hypothetical protein [Hwangdonia sp.]|uniref:hypothetical protein n=1 Tax=Hwangdonia sp. TaxID=1883432 RepID=UPI003AB4A783
MKDLSYEERLQNSWHIDNLKIELIEKEFFISSKTELHLKLKEKYAFGLLSKNIDIVKPNLNLKFGVTDCIIEFERTQTKFNLCKNKQLK